ncbi:MAG: hypothetical protein Hyperionvirus14_27 [Hyperionvirus sp.]|uniref:Uncharacterized protein n=1 Tax=Hyperionvirus sp. TaxID=2487770 RepID=A0A3G5A9J2_9VIRU|nr:MAG: hypothetical protein Hyperionvirus14_27 [Hyperionvirus sp.]
MDLILYDEEWTPKLKDDWVKDRNSAYYVLRNSKPIEYQIDQELMFEMENYNELFDRVKGRVKSSYARKNEEVIKIYVMYDPENLEYYIGYTSRSILYTIKMMLHKYLLGERTALNYFSKKSKNPIGMKIKLLSCLKGRVDKVEMRDIKGRLENKIEFN